ncbi:hypothetical protein A6A04_13505 [Paramagnetospirillum marisnigri]|uniref:Uncharacterized protein n=1 Tax=Paramagnetospirillum marisnigri TaxID=1285242 RepID=A0A178MWQ9_9PROT|nr:hypothetical protein [Paramagnetospirillum marisnigri]OAN53903.1 hypothetical protein A6A04_13505 [Paramagnetospirillum marisnigri]
MSQVDEFAINGVSPLSMATLEARLDALFGAAVSYNRGTTAPSNPFEGMLWWDSSAAPDVLKRYTVAAGWISILTINITTGAIAFAGLGVGSDVQAHDADLDWLSANLTAAGKALLDDADAAAQLLTLGAAPASHTHASSGITDFTEATQDVVGAMVAAAGGSYNDGAGTIAFPAGGGSLTFIDSATASSSASVDIPSGLSSTYDAYLVVFENILPATDGAILRMRMYSGGAFVTTNYNWSAANWGIGSTRIADGASDTATYIQYGRKSKEHVNWRNQWAGNVLRSVQYFGAQACVWRDYLCRDDIQPSSQSAI